MISDLLNELSVDCSQTWLVIRREWRALNSVVNFISKHTQRERVWERNGNSSGKMLRRTSQIFWVEQHAAIRTWTVLYRSVSVMGKMNEMKNWKMHFCCVKPKELILKCDFCSKPFVYQIITNGYCREMTWHLTRDQSVNFLVFRENYKVSMT